MNDRILLAYARAMRSAQQLEGRLKLLLSCHNVVSGVSKNQSPIMDDTFEALLLSADKKTLGQALKGVFLTLGELGLLPFPEDSRKALWETVRARNFVAHDYFAKRSVLAVDENASPYLITELDWFCELFEAWIPSLDKWTDMLLGALGITQDDLQSGGETFAEMASDLRSDQLNALRAQLERIGIDVTPFPADAAQPSLAADTPQSARR